MTAKTVSISTFPPLKLVVDRLARSTDAEMIILFGSRARGDAGAESDWDICVLLPDTIKPGQFTSVNLWPLVSGLGIAVQIYPIRQSVFLQKRNAINSVSHDIDRDGIILYQKPGSLNLDSQRSRALA